MTAKSSQSEGKTDRTVAWEESHRDLKYTQTAQGTGSMMTPGQKKKVLKARAETLAREPEKDEAGAREYLEILEFLLSYERYGIESSFVREVYPLKNFTPLPGTPSYILGIINVRGQILSVMDIKKFFDLPEKGLTDLNKVIILGNEEMAFGILADVIFGSRRIAPADIQPSLPTLTGIREEYLKGVTGERSVILDAGKLLQDKKLVIHEEIEVR